MSGDVNARECIAVWPCDHGGVKVEPGPALVGYYCHVCGAVASTYVLAKDRAEAADRLGQEAANASE